nr:uncharacterized protein LOC114088586 [Marmota flaviventris]
MSPRNRGLCGSGPPGETGVGSAPAPAPRLLRQLSQASSDGLAAEGRPDGDHPELQLCKGTALRAAAPPRTKALRGEELGVSRVPSGRAGVTCRRRSAARAVSQEPAWPGPGRALWRPCEDRPGGSAAGSRAELTAEGGLSVGSSLCLLRPRPQAFLLFSSSGFPHLSLSSTGAHCGASPEADWSLPWNPDLQTPRAPGLPAHVAGGSTAATSPFRLCKALAGPHGALSHPAHRFPPAEQTGSLRPNPSQEPPASFLSHSGPSRLGSHPPPPPTGCGATTSGFTSHLR